MDPDRDILRIPSTAQTRKMSTLWTLKMLEQALEMLRPAVSCSSSSFFSWPAQPLEVALFSRRNSPTSGRAGMRGRRPDATEHEDARALCQGDGSKVPRAAVGGLRRCLRANQWRARRDSNF